MPYYNYIKMTKDLLALRKECNSKYHQTIRLMMDECIGHFLQDNEVPFEKQGEFLTTMFEDTPEIVNEYKNKRFTNI